MLLDQHFPPMPVNASSLLSKPFYCGEQNMFSFAANLYTLLYLRLTNQRDMHLERQAFKYLNLGYQRQLTYQNDDGSFQVFRWHSQPSVWLTAFCARVFHKATFQEWEQFCTSTLPSFKRPLLGFWTGSHLRVPFMRHRSMRMIAKCLSCPRGQKTLYDFATCL
uniref:Alpha-macroglobulin-like TED domain-containing protein n=1 Tax=Rhipicephalus microplus TaxID=6941 RepID=A0A6G5A6Y4_RHIMP